MNRQNGSRAPDKIWNLLTYLWGANVILQPRHRISANQVIIASFKEMDSYTAKVFDLGMMETITETSRINKF